MKDKVRINFDVPRETADRLRRMATEQGTTAANIMRRGIELADALHKELRAGNHLVSIRDGVVLYRLVQI